MRPEAELFIGLKKSGIEIDIITYSDCAYNEKFRAAGIHVIEMHPEKKLSLTSIRFIRKLLKEGKYNIIHLFNNKAITNGIFASMNLPVKVVLYRGYAGNLEWFNPSSYLKHLNPRVDKVMCLAKAVEEYLQQQLFFDKSKAITINKGHDLSWFADVQPIQRESLGLSDTDFVISCVANNRTMKGIPYLLKSFHFIPQELPVHLLLIGKNMDDAENMKIINSSPNKAKIHLTGFRKDALQIVKASDVFALASIKGEATTKAVIEAMSLGVVPVITNVAGNRELVIDRKCGLVVPMKNPEALAHAFLELYRNTELKATLAAQAQKQIATNFSVHQTVKKVKEMYEELLA